MKTYLEYQDDTSHKFWQIKVNGNSHTVRYGKAGTHGRESIKEFINEEIAQNDAQKLIASKKKKGYKEVEPISVDEPVEQVELSRTDSLRRYKKRQFWKSKLSRKFLKETLYKADGQRRGYYDKSEISSILEKISALDFPQLKKEIITDNKNNVAELNYYINDNLIVRFNNMVDNQSYPRFKIFYNGLNYFRYSYCKEEKNPEKGVQLLLKNIASFYQENLAIITEEEKKWTEEYFEKKDRDKDKDKKIKSIAENSIELIIKNLMKATGYPYATKETKTNVLLRIRVSKYKFVEFSLPHKTFLKRIEKVLPSLEIIKQNFYTEDVEYAPIGFVLDSKPKEVKWGDITQRELMYHTSLSENDKLKIVGKTFELPLKEYYEPILGNEKKKFNDIEVGKSINDIEILLKEITQWDIPHLHTEFVEKKHPTKIKYFSNKELMLVIGIRDIVFFDVFCYSFLDYGFPSLESLRTLLDGFMDFYTPYKKIVDKAIRDKNKLLKVETLVDKNLPIVIKEMLDEKKYEYAINLYGSGYGFSDFHAIELYGHVHSFVKYNSFMHGEVYVNIKSVRGRALMIQLEYKHFADNLDKILPTIESVEKATTESPLPFKFLSTNMHEYKHIKWHEEK